MPIIQETGPLKLDPYWTRTPPKDTDIFFKNKHIPIFPQLSINQLMILFLHLNLFFFLTCWVDTSLHLLKFYVVPTISSTTAHF